MFQAHLVFLCPALQSAISSVSLGSFYWRTVLEIKIWALGVPITTGLSLLLGLLSSQSKAINVCIHIFKSINTFLHFKCYLIPSYLYPPITKNMKQTTQINILQGEKNVRILGWKRNKNDTRDKFSKMIQMIPKYVYQWLRRGTILSDFKTQ